MCVCEQKCSAGCTEFSYACTKPDCREKAKSLETGLYSGKQQNRHFLMMLEGPSVLPLPVSARPQLEADFCLPLTSAWRACVSTEPGSALSEQDFWQEHRKTVRGGDIKNCPSSYTFLQILVSLLLPFFFFFPL